MTDDRSAEGLALLRAPFPDSEVGLLPRAVNKQNTDKFKCTEANGRQVSVDGKFCGGYHTLSIHLEYVGHAAITHRLLDVDPSWSWEPLAFTPEGLPAFDRSGGLWIRLTVLGTTRLGYGDAGGKTGPDATKEVIGDAIRNASMRFGAALDLWHKGDLHDVQQQQGSEHRPYEQPGRDWLADARRETAFEGVRGLWAEARTAGASAEVLDAIVEIGNQLRAMEEPQAARVDTVRHD